MVQFTKNRLGNDSALLSGFDAPRHWSIVIKRLMRTRGVYGITGNALSISNFANEVRRVSRKWLARRNRQRQMPWTRFNELLKHYPLPRAVVVHSVYRAQRSRDLRSRMR